jgi:hypothetical protein
VARKQGEWWWCAVHVVDIQFLWLRSALEVEGVFGGAWRQAWTCMLRCVVQQRWFQGLPAVGCWLLASLPLVLHTLPTCPSPLSAGEYDEESQRRDKAKHSLERYMHYFERFDAHDKARNTVREQLLPAAWGNSGYPLGLHVCCCVAAAHLQQ